MNRARVHDILYDILTSFPRELVDMTLDYLPFLPINKIWETELDVSVCLYDEKIGLICSCHNGQICVLDVKTGAIKSQLLSQPQSYLFGPTRHILLNETRDRLITASMVNCYIWKSNDNWNTSQNVKQISFGSTLGGGYDYINCLLLLKSGELLIGGNERNNNIALYNIIDGSLIQEIKCDWQEKIMKYKNGNIAVSYEYESEDGIGILDANTKQLKKFIPVYEELIYTITRDDKLVICDENIDIYNDSYQVENSIEYDHSNGFSYVDDTDATILVGVDSDTIIIDKKSNKILNKIEETVVFPYIYGNYIITTRDGNTSSIYDAFGNFMHNFISFHAEFYTVKMSKQSFLMMSGGGGIACYGDSWVNV